jgi:hypothetical protein
MKHTTEDYCAREERAKMGPNPRHDLQLMQAQMPGMDGRVGRPCSAEDVGDLE